MSRDNETIGAFFCPNKIFTDVLTKTKKSKSSAPIQKTSDIAFFDWLAPRYDKLQDMLDPGHFQAYSIMLDIINAIEPKPQTVLDLGCGTGHLAGQILEMLPQSHVYAVDDSLAMLQTAKENLEEFSDRLTLAKTDFRDPWEEIINEPLDLIVHYNALNNLNHESLRAIYIRLLRSLRPGGWLVSGDFMEERLPVPVRRIAEKIRISQSRSVLADIEDGKSLMEELEAVREMNEARGLLKQFPALPEQHIAWLMEAGFEFAARVYQDWRMSLFVARKPE